MDRLTHSAMGIVVDRFLQSEIESVGGSPAPDARDLAIRDALLGRIDVLLNTTEYDLDSSGGAEPTGGIRNMWRLSKSFAGFTLSNESRSFARHDHPGRGGILRQRAASREKGRTPRSGWRFHSPCYGGEPSHRSDSGNLKRSS